MKYGAVVLILGLMALSCSFDERFDPTIINDGFKGITYADDSGKILGPDDPDDWKVGSSSIRGAFNNDLYNRFFVRCAYPNPANNQINFVFHTPVPTNLFVKIVDDKYRIVKRFSLGLDVFYNVITWDLLDESGHRVEGDVYRVYYQFGSCCGGYGDIWIKY